MAEQDVLALAERFVAAVESGDIATVQAIYAPDAKIWHNFDGLEQTVEQNLRVLGWLARTLPNRRYRVVRREAIEGGSFQQHYLEATLPDGAAWSLPACLVVAVKDGRITRLEEYLDSAQAAVLQTLAR